MKYAEVKYTGHAMRRMFERGITKPDVEGVLRVGEVVEDYPGDHPCPSRLLLSFVGSRPLHVVVAHDEEANTAYVVTAYEPDPAEWESDWGTRR